MASTELNVRQELGDAPLRPFHWLLVGLVALATMFDGFDTFIPAYMIHFVVEPWELSHSSAGFLMSAGLIGFGIGSLSHGIVADRIGRRPTFIAGLLITGVFSVLTGALAHSFEVFIILRVLTGLGLGVLLPLGTAYLNEYLPTKVRNRLAVLGGTGFAVGAVLAAVVGIAVAREGNWHLLYFIGGGAALVGVVYLAVFPESVEYLAARGESAKAARLLARIRPDRARVYESAVLTAVRPAAHDWRLVLAPDYRVRTIGLWLSAFLLLFNVYGLATWTPQLMIQRGEDFVTGFSFGAVLQAFAIAGALVGGFVADRYLGARRSLMVWCAVGSIAALVIAFADSTTLNLIAAGAAGMFIIGGQFLLNNVCAHTYPVQARGTGEGLMLGFGRAGGVLGPYIGGALLGAFGGTAALFVVVAGAAALAVVTTSFAATREEETRHDRDRHRRRFAATA